MTGPGYRGDRKTKSMALKRSPDCKQIIIEMVSVWLRYLQGSPWGKKEAVFVEQYLRARQKVKNFFNSHRHTTEVVLFVSSFYK